MIDKLKWTNKLLLTDPTSNVNSGTDLILGTETFEEITGRGIQKESERPL